MAAKKSFIQQAVPAANRGKFTAKAKSHGETVSQYANQVTAPGSTASSTTKHEAQFAKNMESLAKKKPVITKLSAKKKC